MICKECKVEIKGSICENCGYKNITPKKKFVILSTLSVLILAFIIVVTILLVNANNKKKIEICVTEGQAFGELIENSKRNIENIGILYSSSTKTNTGYIWNEEYFTNYVTGLCSDWISKEKTNMLNIKKQYEIIRDFENKNEKIKNIQKQADNLYNTYEDMYDLIIEQNFTYKNFETKYTQGTRELSMAIELYNDTLDEIKQ